MRFDDFYINSNQIHSVVSTEISLAARNRVVNTNLNGDLLIDQSGLKRTITINIALCSQAEMNIIEAAVNSGSADIIFTENGFSTAATKATCANIVKSRPIYKNGDKTKGVYYNDVTLVWEEI